MKDRPIQLADLYEDELPPNLSEARLNGLFESPEVSLQALTPLSGEITSHMNTSPGDYNNQFLISIIDLGSKLKKAGCLNDEAVPKIRQLLSNKETLEHVSHQANFLSEIHLLNPGNYLQALSNDPILYKSNVARLSIPTGLQFYDTDAIQQRWGFASLGVEYFLLMKFQERTRDSLFDLYQEASDFRHSIAQMEPNYKPEFGQFRKKPSHDRVSFDRKQFPGNLQSEAFPEIVALFNEQVRKADIQGEEMDDYVAESFLETGEILYSPILKYTAPKDALIPDCLECLCLHYKKNNPPEEPITPLFIDAVFFPIEKKKMKFSMNRLDEVLLQPMLTKIREKSYPDEQAFLLDLGKFIYYLTRLYPLRRGSGAVTQWFARALCSYYNSPEPLLVGDIRFGKKQNISYDIYAHYVFNADDYAKVFAENMVRVLAEARARASGEASLNPSTSPSPGLFGSTTAGKNKDEPKSTGFGKKPK